MTMLVSQVIEKRIVKASSSHISGKKVDQEKRARPAEAGKELKEDSPKGADIASGIVKFLVDVVDETREKFPPRSGPVVKLGFTNHWRPEQPNEDR